jgi:hypothetical protein
VLNPLHKAVDPDALDSLFTGSTDAQSDATATPDVESVASAGSRIMFRYEGFEVTVRSDGHITVAPVESLR